MAGSRYSYIRTYIHIYIQVEFKYAVVRAQPGQGIQSQWEAQNRKITVGASG